MHIIAAIAMLAAVGAFSAARAQMSISTFGATDAVLCYEDARDDFSQDTTSCDEALRTDMTAEDEKKTLVNRGIIFNRAGRLNEAISDFNTALDIDAGLAEAYLNRGNSFFLGGRYDDALKDYEDSLRYGISKPWAAWYNIGLARAAKKDAAGAREAYLKALELNPDFTAARDKLDQQS